ncbi:MAG: NB-ARC domain-containing protein [Thermoanaerobaculia bacterium]
MHTFESSWELNPETIRARLAAHFAGRRCLFIIDDVWKAEQVELLRVGGSRSALLVTTRLPAIAAAVAPASDIVTLPGLSVDDGLQLLREFAPSVVDAHHTTCRALIQTLEGLPLAIQVAGRMLAADSRSGFDVAALLESLRSGVVLLDAEAPADMAMMQATTPTVAVLLEKSTEHLDPATLERFAVLGVMTGKETAFDLAALKTMWNTDEPEPTVRTLVDRGLLEFDRESSRYRVHSLLLLHAQELLRRGARAHA